ncbi:AraC family transcriptional regulator, partial [Acidiphilium sp. PM]
MPRPLNPAALSHFGFLLLPNYSMIAVANAIEALRMANRCAGRAVYRWSLHAVGEAPVTASNGLSLGAVTAPESGPA